MLSKLKGFFNNASTLFIIITDEKIYKKTLLDQNARGIEYTFFSQKLYLKRPSSDEIYEFINNIITDNRKTVSNSDIEDYKRYICFQSKSYFYDLYDSLRSDIRIYDYKPVIYIPLTKEQKIKSDLQFYLDNLFNKFLSNGYNSYIDEEIIDTCYKFCNELILWKSFTLIIDPSLLIIFNSSGIIKEMEITQDHAKIILNFIGYLKRVYFIDESNNSYILRENDYCLYKPNYLRYKEEDFITNFNLYKQINSLYTNIYNKFVNSEQTSLNYKSDITNFYDFRDFWSVLDNYIFPFFKFTKSNKYEKVYSDFISDFPSFYSDDKLQELQNDLNRDCFYLLQHFIYLIILVLRKTHSELKFSKVENIYDYFGCVREKSYIWNLTIDITTKSNKKLLIIDNPTDENKRVVEANFKNNLSVILIYTPFQDNYRYKQGAILKTLDKDDEKKSILVEENKINIVNLPQNNTTNIKFISDLLDLIDS